MPALLEAPVRLAAAYGAEVETVAVSEVHQLDDVPVRHVGCTEAADPPLAPGSMSVADRRFALLTQRYRRIVDVAGSRHGVKVRHTEANGDAVDHISEMCLARGPWNIVALARMPALGGHSLLSSLLANVSGATGFLLCGEQRIKAGTGVVVVAEDADRLPPMLRAAERLSAPGSTIRLVIGADTAAGHAELEVTGAVAHGRVQERRIRQGRSDVRRSRRVSRVAGMDETEPCHRALWRLVSRRWA